VGVFEVLIIGTGHADIGVGKPRPLIAKVDVKLRLQRGARKGWVEVKRRVEELAKLRILATDESRRSDKKQRQVYFVHLLPKFAEPI
jgi:hypothetical protein